MPRAELSSVSESQSGGDATENIEAQKLDLAHNHLELQVVQKGEREFRFPFFEEVLDLGTVAAAAFPNGAPWTASLEDGAVLLRHTVTDETHPLAVGGSVMVENRQVWLVDVRQSPLGSIEGMTAPYAGRVWHLKNHQSWLGRKGKRLNHIDLDHPTVSRTHATFTPQQSGRINLLCESGASPTTVNGQPLAPGVVSTLSNGDLLGFGQLLFRFSGLANPAADESTIFVNTLGSFRVSMGNKDAPEISIKNEKARWLLALLATRWGSPYPVEPLIEKFWPEVQATRGRKNLSYTLGQLKESFKAANVPFESIVLRNPAELRLNPERLGTHDFVEVAKIVGARRAITSASALKRLLALFTSNFLPTCYEGWADELRVNLEQDAVATLRATAEHFLGLEEHESVTLASKGIHSLNPTDEQATIIFMESALVKAKPEQAVEAYEELLAHLKADELEPSIELVKLYHRAKMGV